MYNIKGTNRNPIILTSQNQQSSRSADPNICHHDLILVNCCCTNRYKSSEKFQVATVKETLKSTSDKNLPLTNLPKSEVSDP